MTERSLTMTFAHPARLGEWAYIVPVIFTGTSTNPQNASADLCAAYNH